MSRMKLFVLEEEVVDVQEVAESLTPSILEDENMLIESTDPITDGIDAVDELTEVKDVMDQSIEAGTGLDPVAAEMARISIRNILSKIGAEHYTSQMMVASESFGSTSSRLANTRYASENVGKFIEDVIARIKKAFADLFAKIGSFLENIFSHKKIVLNGLDALIAKYQKTEKSEYKGNVTVKGSALKKLYKTVGKDGNVITAMSQQGKFVKEFVANVDAGSIAKLMTGPLPEGQESEARVPQSGEFFGGLYFVTKESKVGSFSVMTAAETKGETPSSDKETETFTIDLNKTKIIANMTMLKSFINDSLEASVGKIKELEKIVKNGEKAPAKEDKEALEAYKAKIKVSNASVKVMTKIVTNSYSMVSSVTSFYKEVYKMTAAKAEEKAA